MSWLVVVVVLLLPFALLRFDRHVAGRVALLLFWVGCAGGGAWFLKEARRAGKDVETVHTYPLPSSRGTHRIALAPLSQGSMKGVLRGGAGSDGRPELKEAGWSFTDPKIPATWFEPREHDPAGPGETLLFYVDGMGSEVRPAILEYRVEGSRQSWFQGRVLAVGHDAGAKHLLKDYAKVFLDLFGWGLILWSGLWMTVQVNSMRRWAKPDSAPAPGL